MTMFATARSTDELVVLDVSHGDSEFQTGLIIVAIAMFASLRSRSFFDALQHKWLSASRFTLPCPPYDSPEYWDRVYRNMDGDDVLEWGGFDLEHGLRQFRCESLLHLGLGLDGWPREEEGGPRMSTFAECLDVGQWRTPEEACDAHNKNAGDEAVLLLGCGTSKMGEQMLQNCFAGPVIQVDISSKAIKLMTRRYQKYLDGAAVRRMEFIVDDARGLTALGPASVGGGVVDKGLIDDLHCVASSRRDARGEGAGDVRRIVDGAHRVLRPSRPFVFFSRSRPEYVLRRTLGNFSWTDEVRARWKEVRVLRLPDLEVLLYRFVKADAVDVEVGPRIDPRRLKKRRKR